MRTLEQQIKEFETLTELLEDLEREGITGTRRKKIAEEFLYLKARASRIPYSGGFELTPLCNLNCKMCYVHLSRQQIDPEQMLSTEQWIEIIKEAVDAGMLYADITGGECLTHPGFKDIYRYLYSSGVRITILTNGVLIDEGMVEFFKKYKPAHVQISLYGSDGEAYKRVTGYDVFDRVVNAIELLKKAQIDCNISITPSIYMKDDKENILKFARTLGVKYSIGAVSLPARPDTGREVTTIAVENSVYVDMRIDEKAYRSTQEKTLIKPYRFDIVGSGKEVGIGCSSGRCSFHVNWKGEMTPCVPYYTVKRSIKEYGFLGAWEEIKTAMETYVVPQECKNCEYADGCSSCPAEKTSGILNGTLNTNVCERFKMVLEKCWGLNEK